MTVFFVCEPVKFGLRGEQQRGGGGGEKSAVRQQGVRLGTGCHALVRSMGRKG